jgi:DNA primase catalytic subunit
MPNTIRLINNIEQYSLGELCSFLAEANINIYKYENKKWWGRKRGEATNKEINEWDKASRAWNEKRSQIKNRIDTLLREAAEKTFKTRASNPQTNKTPFSFQVLPISLMIDMLTIENIKIYDLTLKDNKEGVAKATARKNELQKTIDNALAQILQMGKYELQAEARTF